MPTKLSNLDKVKFLVDELGRQAHLYDLTMIVIMADEKQEGYNFATRGSLPALIRQLAHLTVEIGIKAKDHFPKWEKIFGHLMRVSIESIKEENE